MLGVAKCLRSRMRLCPLIGAVGMWVGVIMMMLMMWVRPLIIDAVLKVSFLRLWQKLL